MSRLRSLFGPSKEDVWRRLSSQIGGEYVTGGLASGSDAVQARVSDWIVTLDTFTSDDSGSTATRLRAPFVNPEGLIFTVRRAGLFTELGKRLFGMQDVEVGDARFDAEFVVKGSPAAQVQELFADEEIRRLLRSQPKVRLSVKDDEGWFGASFPDGVDELYLEALEVIKDLDRLVGLYDLFAAVLHRMSHMSAAYRDEVGVAVQALLAPGGTIRGGRLTLWEGDEARVRAARTLGRLGDPRAIPALGSTLGDRKHELRAEAVAALEAIGDRAAVPLLIPLLGEDASGSGSSVAAAAERALRRLGEDDRVDAFDAALVGAPADLRSQIDPYRSAVIDGLVNALDGSSPERTANAAGALAAIGAYEALDSLRAMLRFSGRSSPRGVACNEAILELEAQASLPRPAVAVEPASDTLPRPSEAPEGRDGSPGSGDDPRP